MYCMVVGAVVNLILDPIFIFVFDMGMAGAAYATILGQFFYFLLIIFYFARCFKSLDLEGKYFDSQLDKIINIVRLGAASGFNQAAILFVQILMNNFYRYYGALSEYGSNIPLAAVGIVMKVAWYFSVSTSGFPKDFNQSHLLIMVQKLP